MGKSHIMKLKNRQSQMNMSFIYSSKKNLDGILSQKGTFQQKENLFFAYIFRTVNFK